MGRPPGSGNKSSLRADLTCQIRNFSSIDGMIDAAQIALEKFVEHSQKEQAGTISPMESQAAVYLALYLKACSTIAKFIHPQRKSIEVTQTDALKDMSPSQRLDAMKQAVAMLELQVKKDAGPGNS